jgi:hypothetical protein
VKTAVSIGAAALVAFASALAFAPAHRPLAPTTIGIERSHFNTMQAGDRLLTAGALGEILYSDDKGAHWQQAQIKEQRQALIVSMAFAPDKKDRLCRGARKAGFCAPRTEAAPGRSRFLQENGEPLMSIAPSFGRLDQRRRLRPCHHLQG